MMKSLNDQENWSNLIQLRNLYLYNDLDSDKIDKVLK
jgi:hypothetical protein